LQYNAEAGRSFGKYFVFNGPLKVSDRYDGMRAAFGADNEIYLPTQVGLRHASLNTAAFDRLLLSADQQFQATIALAAPGFVSNHYLENPSNLPIFHWARGRHGFWKMGICVILSLTPLLQG
jgi:hypothetical protein